LVPIKDVDAIVDRMIYFINNPNIIIDMGMKSRRIAEEKFDVNKVNSVILKTMGIEEKNAFKVGEDNESI